MTQGLIAKLVSVLESTVSKLGRYDEGSLIGSLLSFTVSSTIVLELLLNNSARLELPTSRSYLFQNVSGSGKDTGQAYVNFTRNCMDQIRGKVVDELWILNFFEVTNHSMCTIRLYIVSTN